MILKCFILIAGTYDNAQQRLIDRIKCIAFREVRDTGATFVTQEWIAEKLHRSIRWVREWWKKSPEDCFVEYVGGRKEILSQESKNLVLAASHKQKRSCNHLVREILEKRGKVVSYSTVYRFRVSEGLKPFHVTAKPLKTQTHIEDRLWLCEWLSEWDASGFIHLAPSDEFFV